MQRLNALARPHALGAVRDGASRQVVRRGRKKRHEAEKCISLLGAGGRHPEGRYGGTKVFPKAGNHFSSDRLNVAAEGWPPDLLTHV